MEERRVLLNDGKEVLVEFVEDQNRFSSVSEGQLKGQVGGSSK